MQRFPIKPGGSDPTVQKLVLQVNALQQKLNAIQKCLVVDSTGSTATLKASGKLTIQGGSAVEIKSSAMLTVQAGGDSVMAALAQVEALAGWARKARESIGKKTDTDVPIKLDLLQRAEAWLITEALPSIYEKHFGREFGYSGSSKAGPGPAIEFVRACLAALDIEKSPGAIVKVWQRRPRSIGDALLGDN